MTNTMTEFMERFPWKRFSFIEPNLGPSHLEHYLVECFGQAISENPQSVLIFNDPIGAISLLFSKFGWKVTCVQDSDLAWKSLQINFRTAELDFPERKFSYSEDFGPTEYAVLICPRQSKLLQFQIENLAFQNPKCTVYFGAHSRDLGPKNRSYTQSHLQLKETFPFVKKHKIFVFEGFKHSFEKPTFLKELNKSPFEGFMTAPGVFSSDHPDEGTLLLMEHLPQHQQGKWLDLGVGSGLLTKSFQLKNPDALLYACDENALARKTANHNLADLKVEIIGGNGSDQFREEFDGAFSNLPQHLASSIDLKMSRRLLRNLGEKMKSKAPLFLVLTKGLQIEKLLPAKDFESITVLAQGLNHRVIQAIKI